VLVDTMPQLTHFLEAYEDVPMNGTVLDPWSSGAESSARVYSSVTFDNQS